MVTGYSSTTVGIGFLVIGITREHSQMFVKAVSLLYMTFNILGGIVGPLVSADDGVGIGIPLAWSAAFFRSIHDTKEDQSWGLYAR